MELRIVDVYGSIDLEGIAAYYGGAHPELKIKVEKLDPEKSDRMSAWLFRVEKGHQLENIVLDSGTPQEAYQKIELRMPSFLKG